MAQPADKRDSANVFSHKKVFFWKKDNQALVAQIASIQGKSYVGLSKFWKIPTWGDRWAPSKKGHLYLTVEQWKALTTKVTYIDAAVTNLDALLCGKREGNHF